MKLTKTQLKQIIKEEMNKTLLEKLIKEATWAQQTAEKEAASKSYDTVKQAGVVLALILDSILSLGDAEQLRYVRMVQTINRTNIDNPASRLKALQKILKQIKNN